MATLKTVKDMQDAIIAGAGDRGTTGSALIDIIESLASVFGVMTMNLPGVNHTFSGAWENWSRWQNSRDTRGLLDDLVAGDYELKAGADGRWVVGGYIKYQANTVGTYRWRPRLIKPPSTHIILLGQDEHITTAVGETVRLLAVGLTPAASDAVVADKLSMQVRGPAGAIATPLSGFQIAARV